MTHQVLSSFRKLLPDALAGVVTFAAISGLTCGNTSVAAAQASSLGQDPQSALLLAAGAFSLLVAANSAFVRHLLRTYRAPRRGEVRRRSQSDAGNHA